MQNRNRENMNRRRFLAGAGTIGLSAAGTGLLTGCGGIDYSQNRSTAAGATSSDADILNAAKIAEASAVTVYTEIVQTAPFFTHLSTYSQNYFRAALQEDMAHYDLIKSASGGAPSPITTFYFPAGMFQSAKTTLDTVVALEEAFIAAYLIAVRDFTTSDNRVLAARILGVQSNHRLLARVAAAYISGADGGPFATVKGLAGQEESVDPPNNNVYERTYHLTSIQDAVTALTPFIDKTAAAAKGFDTTKPYTFQPFTPVAPSALGNINA